MSPTENRDDIIKRMLDQKMKDKRREVTSKEKAEIAEYVKTKVLPQAYEDK